MSLNNITAIIIQSKIGVMLVADQRKNSKLYLGIIVVLAIALAVSLYLNIGPAITGGMISGDNAMQNIKDIYKIQTDRDVEILSSKLESGIYHVVVRAQDLTGAPVVQDIYITTDGKLLTDKMLQADQYKTALESNKNFITCLSDKGVRVVGLSSNNYTVLQMQVLGTFGYKIYFDCGGNNLQTCQQLGVKTIPSIVYNQTIYEGAQPIAWFEQLTNCTYQQ
jgi:hypothetical protein